MQKTRLFYLRVRLLRESKEMRTIIVLKEIPSHDIWRIVEIIPTHFSICVVSQLARHIDIRTIDYIIGDILGLVSKIVNRVYLVAGVVHTFVILGHKVNRDLDLLHTLRNRTR